MTQPPDIARGRREGMQWAVSWLHNRAEEMNDPHARTVLQAAAFQMGNDAKKAMTVRAARHTALRLKRAQKSTPVT